MPLTARQQAGFDHLVVLMGENRSFDNLLGYLYSADDLPDGETYEGLAFGDYSNTSPDGSVVAAHVYEGPTDDIMGRPNPDPGEEFPHVNTQIFDTVDPATNAELFVEAMSAPYNTPSRDVDATMSGFVRDYWINFMRLRKGAPPSADEAQQIMGSFSPQMLPVLSTLAKNFAVYDNWYCAVPSQTFCNRSFFHASTSHGFVTNKAGGGYEKWLDAAESPTIFNRLEEAGISWRIYYDELQLVSFTGVLHAPVLEPYWRTDHFATMSDFYEDVKLGTLPAYSFIEPRMTYNHNDFHPPFGRLKEDVVEGRPRHRLRRLRRAAPARPLVHEIYEAIKRSARPDGSNAMNTMFLITFDEHGGTYDHVPPPPATPPHDDSEGEMGFRFDRLGCRVPAIAVSAYTRAGTIVHDEMHHAAVIATLTRLHGLKPLTRRDLGANNLFNAVNLDQPRQPISWPATTPQYIPPNPQTEAPASGPRPQGQAAQPAGARSARAAPREVRRARRRGTRDLRRCVRAAPPLRGGAVRQAAVTAPSRAGRGTTDRIGASPPRHDGAACPKSVRSRSPTSRTSPASRSPRKRSSTSRRSSARSCRRSRR